MLGTGTSTGVPVIGCGCAVCTSADPATAARRPGLKLEWGGHTVLVDTPTDLREIRRCASACAGWTRVLFTHSHADHIFGLDDLRIFNFRQQQAIPCYGSAATMARHAPGLRLRLRGGPGGRRQAAARSGGGAGPFPAARVRVVPVPVLHGEMEVSVTASAASPTSPTCQSIPDESFVRLAGRRDSDSRRPALPAASDPLHARRGDRGGVADRRAAHHLHPSGPRRRSRFPAEPLAAGHRARL